MHKKMTGLARAIAALSLMAFWSSATAVTGEYAAFNHCPDNGSGSEDHPRGPLLKWWARIHSAIHSAPIKCKEISTCYVGSGSPVALHGEVRVHLENPLLGVTATRRCLLDDGEVLTASRAGGGRERAYVAAIGLS
jgi:hypothetical protein